MMLLKYLLSWYNNVHKWVCSLLSNVEMSTLHLLLGTNKEIIIIIMIIIIIIDHTQTLLLNCHSFK